ncbi:rCG58889, partial [Rattus norvegicus]
MQSRPWPLLSWVSCLLFSHGARWCSFLHWPSSAIPWGFLF